ncbi:hypothetical protein J4439_07955 [Candidatus Woesearchaeota archaeon]|nr:hypothetical protein [Candidatus Woesearchaeota archaeon]
MQAEGYIHGITTHSDAALREELDIKYGRVKRREKKDVLGRDADELIALQAKLGFKRVSDGQLLWPDLFRPAYLLMEGVTIGSQTRWFDTNGFAFTPLLDGKLSTRSADLSPVLFREKIPSSSVPKVTLPGPVTLAAHTEGAEDWQSLIPEYAQHIALLSRELRKHGYRHIEYAEPSLLLPHAAPLAHEEGVVEACRAAYGHIVHGLDATTIIQLFFGNPNSIPPALLELPVSGFLLDLVEAPIADGTKLSLKGKILVAGAIDSRSSVPEDLGLAERRVQQAVKALHPREVHITTNGPLFYTISSEPSREKLREIAALAAKVAA